MNSPPPDKTFFDRLEGTISADEAALLYRLAARPHSGCIVEIGSWRGKSAIAMALGTKALPEKRPKIFCVEPDADFISVRDGKFGPGDRTAFFKAMLDADCAEIVALVNLPSTTAAKGWKTPIGLLFIDGDHTEAAVQADVDAWAPYLVENGIVVFDGALDESTGPARVIRKMLATGAYRRTNGTGKTVVLKKIPDAARATLRSTQRMATEGLQNRAKISRYDPEFAISRLRYGSYVSLSRRYMYVETPKAACTSIKRMLVELEGAAYDQNARAYQRETRRGMLIHQRRYVDIPSLFDVPASVREEILSGTNGWFVFAVARNPFSRLVSVFENKIRLGEPRYRALESHYDDLGAFSDPRAGFAAFIAEVIGNKDRREKDPHFIAQTQLLMPRLIPYTRVFNLEYIGEMTAALRKHIADCSADKQVLLANENASLGKPWRDYYDTQSARIVAEAYAGDFDTFGYDREDWRGSAQAIIETENDRRWRAQIVERNAFIDRMYDWIDELRED